MSKKSFPLSKVYTLIISVLCIFIASCNSVGVGGTVSGGSSSGVNVGAGVKIHLYTDSKNQTENK